MRSIIILLFTCLSIASAINPSLNKTQDCKCRTPINSRIVNGKDASLASYPWQLSMQGKEELPVRGIFRRMMPNSRKSNKHQCGAVLINSMWAVTAGHCVKDPNEIENLEIGYGSNDLVKIYDDEKYVKIEKTILHPRYQEVGEAVFNDIGLIKFKTPIEFDKFTQPACIATKPIYDYGKLLKMTGFGLTEVVKFDTQTGRIYKSSPARFLQVGNTVDQSDSMNMCRNRQKFIICVDNQSTQESACKGDSGGPLHYDENGKTQVIGLTSFADAIYIDDYIGVICTGPAAYTRIRSYIDFIEEHVGDQYCS